MIYPILEFNELLSGFSPTVSLEGWMQGLFVEFIQLVKYTSYIDININTCIHDSILFAQNLRFVRLFKRKIIKYEQKFQTV